MTVKKIIKKKVTPIKEESEPVWHDVNNEESYPAVTKQMIRDSFGSDFTLEFDDRKISGQMSELPHCCGIYEIGNLSIDRVFPQKAFNELMNGFCAEGFTLCVNTVTTSISDRTWASLLEKCPSFTEVKSFVNPNSKNTIRMWISNN